MELDTHADTCALGDACLILGDSGDVVDVGGFGEGVGMLKDVKIVHGAVAYDCPTTYKTFILIYHQALLIPGMEVHLLNPFQMREQGITVNDIPLQQLSKNQRTQSSHSIINEDPELTIPLSTQGTMSGFTVRKLTWDEVLDDGLAVKVHMTSDAKWKPNSKLYAEVEEALRRDIDRDVVLPRDISSTQARGRNVSAVVGDDSPTTVATPSPKTYSCYQEYKDSGDELVDNDGTKVHSHERGVSLKALMQQEGYKGVLEIDELRRLEHGLNGWRNGAVWVHPSHCRHFLNTEMPL